MAESRYGDLFKKLSFKEGGLSSLRQSTTISAEVLGYDVCIEYGSLWSAGQMGQAPYDAEVHEFDEVMLWMGADTSDLGYLGAEVEMLLGEEPEKQMITTSTAIAIPKGLPHTPPNILRMDDRFIQMTISVTGKMSARTLHLEKAPTWVWGFQSRFKDHHQHLKFERNGPWHYGPKNADTHGGAITEVHGKEFDFHMSYESMRKAPYRFSPNPDKPHVHPYTEFLLFMGSDCRDLSRLGAEIEVYMGKEGERHVVTEPTIVVQPAGHPHLPQIVLRQENPWIFCVIRPWGHLGEKPNPNLP